METDKSISPHDDGYDEIDKAYFEAFNEHLPLDMIPQVETLEGLKEKVLECVKQGKNLLPDYYGWNDLPEDAIIA